MSEQDDLKICQTYLGNGSSTFHAASRLLPASAVQGVTALYAFCRVADDLVDDSGLPIDTAIAQLHQRLDAVFANTPMDSPEDRQLALAVDQYALPRVVFDALLEGFRWDSSNRRYETLAELEDYGARVAGSVGVAMAAIMGVHSKHQLARAADLGTAMQLTNICRDVGQDARMGRLYLPQRLMREVGLQPDTWLADPHMSPQLAQVVQQTLDHAQRLYRRAAPGINRLPRRYRFSIRAAARIYRDIGRSIALQGYNSVDQRAYVAAARRGYLLLVSMVPMRAGGEVWRAPASQANDFLVQHGRLGPHPGLQLRFVSEGLSLLVDIERRRSV